MPDVLTNRCSFTLGAAITSSGQTSITRTSASCGLPGDSNGPPTGTYKITLTDGTNYEIAQVTGGQGTTDLTIARAVEAIGGVQTALSNLASGSVVYATTPASDLALANYATLLDFQAQSPAFIAHRGSRAVWPEHTVEAYLASIDYMLSAGLVPAIKVDPNLMGDGANMDMHDPTVNRTTTSPIASDAVTNYDAGRVKALRVNAPGLYGPMWGTLAVPLFNEVLNLLGGKAVLTIEPKTSNAQLQDTVLPELVNRGLQPSVLIVENGSAGTTPNQFPPIIATVPGAAAIPCVYLYNGTSITTYTPASVIADGYAALGISTQYTDAQITSVVSAAHTAGLKVYGFSYTRRYDYTRMSGLGVDCHWADDIEYISSSVALGAASLFQYGAIQPGLIDYTNGENASGYQWAGPPGSYRLQLSGITGPTGSSIGYAVGLGFLGPFPTSTVYSITGTFTWDQIDSNTGAWAGIFLSVDDVGQVGQSGDGADNGYFFRIEQGGQLAIQRWDRGSYNGSGGYPVGTVTTLGTASGSAMVSGTSYAFTIARATGGVWTWTIDSQTVTETDTTYTPLYPFFTRYGTAGAAGLAVSLSGVTRSP